MATPPPDPRALRLLAALSDQAGSPLDDARTPPPDVYRHLADYQLRRADVARMCRVLEEEWPAVARIDCGVDHGGTPHLDIQVLPYPGVDAARTLYRGLLDWIQSEFPGTRRLGLHLYPPLDPRRIHSSVTLYERPAEEDVRRRAA